MKARHAIRLIFFAIAAVSFGAVLFTYNVRFTEQAVKTRFGSAGKEAITRAGIHFRLPYPIESVTKYDTRARIVKARPDTLQTADSQQVVVQAFLTWRVADPLKFFQKFSASGSGEEAHYRAAEETIQSLLRSSLAEIGRYRLTDLFTVSDDGATLAELESSALARLTSTGESGARLDDYGVAALTLGVNQIVLPEDTTSKVFERMSAAQARLADEARSQGDSRAAAIRAEAESARSRILSFANRRAEVIRNKGDLEAATFLKTLNQAPELAVFLEQIEFMRRMYSREATLVLPTSMPGLGVFDPAQIGANTPTGVPPFVAEPGSAPPRPGSPAVRTDVPAEGARRSGQ